MKRIINACFDWFEAGIDLLFPPRCVVCGRAGSYWCATCQAQVSVIRGKLCPRCGQPGSGKVGCSHCLPYPHISAVRSYAWYRNAIIPVILTLKYRPNHALVRRLSCLLAEVVIHANWGLDLVVGVPLGQARFKQRGYNQAELLAAGLANELGVLHRARALLRQRETASQVGLDRRGRLENVHLAFEAEPQDVYDRRVLVVDDLLTSGATLSSCASALMKAGARRVFGVTVARACRTD